MLQVVIDMATFIKQDLSVRESLQYFVNEMVEDRRSHEKLLYHIEVFELLMSKCLKEIFGLKDELCIFL